MNDFVEAKQDFLAFLGLNPETTFPNLETLVRGESKYIRDTKFNLKSCLNSPNLSLKETSLIAYAIAVNDKNGALASAFETMSRSNGASDAEIAEAAACASLLALNNVLYRFRHFANQESYNAMPAKIKMTLMNNPVLGKELFELVSLVVSAVNGCESCVVSHEAAVRAAGSSEARIFDAVKLGATVRAACALIS